jgi:uncharacterized protein (DUF1697 family)
VALVVLLRGVNVGGHRTFRPTTLARQLRHLDVVNIGAAGTFVVRKPITRARLRAEVARRLPFDAEILICDGREITRLVTRDPFAGQPDRPDVIRFVTVLARRPRPAPMPVTLPARGKWLVKILATDGRFVLGVHRRQMEAIGYIGRLDRDRQGPATTRGWGTITAIATVLAAERRGRGVAPRATRSPRT